MGILIDVRGRQEIVNRGSCLEIGPHFVVDDVRDCIQPTKMRRQRQRERERDKGEERVEGEEERRENVFGWR
jgi:hypothetical protein